MNAVDVKTGAAFIKAPKQLYFPLGAPDVWRGRMRWTPADNLFIMLIMPVPVRSPMHCRWASTLADV